MPFTLRPGFEDKGYKYFICDNCGWIGVEESNACHYSEDSDLPLAWIHCPTCHMTVNELEVSDPVYNKVKDLARKMLVTFDYREFDQCHHHHCYGAGCGGGGLCDE